MRRSVLTPLLFAIGPWLPACGGTVEPIKVAAGCPDMPLRGPEQFANAEPEAVIDDFEDGDLRTIAIAGRSGSWYSFPVTSAAASGEASSRCAARGLRAGHFVVAASDNPTNWNVTMVDPFTSVIPYDTTSWGWGGFSFWVATGDPAGEGTAMTVGANTPEVIAGGGCTTCGDYHSTSVTLTRHWTRWSIRFDDLRQRGFGMPPVPRVARDQLVNFIFWPPNPFDIWIDDLRFEP
jgi:hypothetical protein